MAADRSVTVRLRADVAQYQRALAAAAGETGVLAGATNRLDGSLGQTEAQSKRTGSEIDKLSGRLRVATDAALILGPALSPLGAAAVGGLAALTAQAGAAAGALGVLLLAVNGVGDGLKALDAYQLDPTAANLKKVNQQLEKLGPSGEHFVRTLDALEPRLKTLQMTARDRMFPGFEDAIDSLLQRLPDVRKLVRGFSEEVGNLAADAGAEIGGPKFDAFFKYLKTEGVPILDDTARTVGNLAEAGLNLIAAFAPVQTDFSGGLLKWSQDIEKASENLDSNAGFQDFLDYIQTEGPKVLDTLESVGNAVLQIVEASAPLGGPVLTGLTAFADVLAAIADSDLGTPIFTALAALALYNRATQVTVGLNKTAWGGAAIGNMKAFKAELTTVTTAQDRARMSAQELDAANAQSAAAWKGGLSTIGKAVGVVGALALAQSGLAEQTGLSNTANLALMGTLAGPVGAGVGAAIGAILDLKATYDSLNDSIDNLDTAAAGGDIDALVQQIAAAKKQLADLQNGPSTTRAAEYAIPGVGGLFQSQDQLAATKADDLAASIAAAEKQLAALRDGSASAFNPVHDLASALQVAANGAEQAATSIEDATQAMHDQRTAAINAFDAITGYRQAMKDAAKQAQANSAGIDGNTDAALKNRDALSHLAAAWNAQDETITGNVKKLHEARQNFIDTATAMGVPEAAARRLARQMLDIPESRVIAISTPGIDVAQQKAKTLKQILDGLHSKDINIALHYQTIGNKPHAPTPGGAGADGMTVPGPRHPYGDKMLILAAPGERVISNRYGQADRHSRLLDAINADRMADGGTAGGSAGRHHSRPYTLFTSAAGTEIIDSAHGLAQALNMLQAALAKSEKSLDKERQARDDAQQAYDSFRSSVGSAYSTMDPFAAASGSAWSGGGGSPLSVFDTALATNTTNTQAAQAALTAAAGKGLDGPLYQALAASGNLQLLQAFAGLSSSDIAQREQQFAAQSNAQSTLGSSAAAQAGLTAQLVDANKHLDDIRAEVRDLRHDVRQADQNNQAAQKQNAKDVKDGVNGAAANGHRRGR